MGKKPQAFIRSKPFQLVFGVYFATYATANLLDSSYAAKNNLPLSTQSSTSTKLICTTAVSTTTCIYKDGRLARIFGSAAKSARVPLRSYALFTLRDAVTIHASFTLPVAVAPRLAQFASTSKLGYYFEALKSESISLKTSQMALPAITQFLTTPIHLLGLDYHNNRGRIDFRNRVSTILNGVRVAIPLRILRIVPAFGVGNVVNTSMREALLR